jgi:hypothetical protein
VDITSCSNESFCADTISNSATFASRAGAERSHPATAPMVMHVSNNERNMGTSTEEGL